MSSPKLIAIALVLAASASVSANAQTWAPPDRLNVNASDRHAPPRSGFLAGYAVDGSNGRWVVEFFSVYVEGGAPTFAARRALDAFDAQEQEQLVEMASCPAMSGVLEAISNLPALAVQVGNLRRSETAASQSPHAPGPPSTDDAANYTVWGRTRQEDGAYAQLKISANTGAIAAFGRFAEEQLADCWASPTP